MITILQADNDLCVIGQFVERYNYTFTYLETIKETQNLNDYRNITEVQDV